MLTPSISAKYLHLVEYGNGNVARREKWCGVLEIRALGHILAPTLPIDTASNKYSTIMQ